MDRDGARRQLYRVGGQGEGQDMTNGQGALVIVGESTLEQTAGTAC